MRVIQTSKTNLINRRYQIKIVSILKNLKNRSRRYSNNYIIKFVGFMSIYYAFNLNIVLFCMIFSNLYIGSIDIL